VRRWIARGLAAFAVAAAVVTCVRAAPAAAAPRARDDVLPAVASLPQRRVPTGLLIPLPVPNPLPSIGSAAGGLVGDSASTVLNAVATWVADGAAGLLGELATEIDQTTTANDTQAWLAAHYTTMLEIVPLFAFPLLCAAAITAIVRRDGGLLIRAAFVQLPLAMIGTGAAMALVGIALTATDVLCQFVTQTTEPDTAALLRNLMVALTRGGPGVTGFGLVMVALLIAVGGFFLTVELVVRAAAIWVALLFLPLGLIGLVWPATAKWGRRLAELLVVLILSKFVIVAIVSMAVDAAGTGTGPSLLGGAALLLLAAAAPFTLLRMVPLVEAGVVAHLEGAGRRAVSLPPVARQALQPQALAGLLMGGAPTEGAPTTSPGAVGGPSTPVAAVNRGVDADGTQSSPDKPVLTADADGDGWHDHVRVLAAPSAHGPTPGGPGAPPPGPSAGPSSSPPPPGAGDG